MARAQVKSAARDQLNIRASRAQRDTIDQAAAILGKTRTDFILESAVRDAQNVLLDQRFFLVSDLAFERIIELIDNPPPPSDALRKMLKTPAPWE
jgi:uncharacterized protein (DUF1778 family)